MTATTSNQRLQAWVDEWAAVLQPAQVHWCDGTAAEYEQLCADLVASGTFTKLDEGKRPGSYWAHSDPGDVARVEDRTFICSEKEEDAGPTNNWRAPDDMRPTMSDLFAGSMRCRTMYLVPVSIGPLGSATPHDDATLTDSPYLVVSTRNLHRI